MSKDHILSEKDALKKLAKEDNKKSKKYKKAKRDAWTAVAVIATVMLIAVGLSFYKTSNIEIKEYSGKSVAKEHEKRENAKNIIIGLGVVCAGILVVALVNRNKNKNYAPSKEELQRMEQKKLSEARERVEEARRHRLEEEANVTMTRTNREHMNHAMDGYKQGLGDRANLSEMGIDDREAYLERRKREYQYYMENGLDDDEMIESETSMQGRIHMKNINATKKKSIIIGAGVGLAILAIIVIFILL